MTVVLGESDTCDLPYVRLQAGLSMGVYRNIGNRDGAIHDVVELNSWRVGSFLDNGLWITQIVDRKPLDRINVPSFLWCTVRVAATVCFREAQPQTCKASRHRASGS